MGQIIYCSDLVLRIDESEEVQNITEWLMESTEYRPVNPEGCVLRDEMTTVVSTKIREIQSDVWPIFLTYVFFLHDIDGKLELSLLFFLYILYFRVVEQFFFILHGSLLYD